MKVELIPAYCWDCPECGRENLQRSVIIQMDEEELNILVSEGYPEDKVSGHWVTRPNNVTCKHCSSSYEATDMDEEEIDDSEE